MRIDFAELDRVLRLAGWKIKTPVRRFVQGIVLNVALFRPAVKYLPRGEAQQVVAEGVWLFVRRRRGVTKRNEEDCRDFARRELRQFCVGDYGRVRKREVPHGRLGQHVSRVSNRLAEYEDRQEAGVLMNAVFKVVSDGRKLQREHDTLLLKLYLSGLTLEEMLARAPWFRGKNARQSLCEAMYRIIEKVRIGLGIERSLPVALWGTERRGWTKSFVRGLTSYDKNRTRIRAEANAWYAKYRSVIARRRAAGESLARRLVEAEYEALQTTT